MDKTEVRRDEEPSPEDSEQRIQKIKSFFYGPDNNNEVSIIPGENSEDFRIKAIIGAGSIEIDSNFSFGIEGNASYRKFEQLERLTGANTYYDRLTFDDISFFIDGKVLRFNELCPSGVDLALQENVDARYTSLTGEITLGHLSSLDDFVSLLHEIGHAIDFKQRGDEYYMEDNEPHDIEVKERNAWAEALKIARKYDIPIISYIKKAMKEGLHSYESDMKGSAITNETRKKIRKEKLRKQ